jgi:hypothetical protein
MRRIGAAVASTVAVLAAGTAPASAAVVRYHFTPEETEQEILEFSECVIRQQPDLARQVLALPLSGPEQNALIVQHFSGDHPCLPRGRRIQLTGALTLVGALATVYDNSLYARYDLAAEVEKAASITPRNGGEVYGLCLVRKAPEAAVLAVRSKPGSKGEDQAMTALEPAIETCAGPAAGMAAAMSRTQVRRLLALTLYRYAVQAEARVPAP